MGSGRFWSLVLSALLSPFFLPPVEAGAIDEASGDSGSVSACIRSAATAGEELEDVVPFPEAQGRRMRHYWIPYRFPALVASRPASIQPSLVRAEIVHLVYGDAGGVAGEAVQVLNGITVQESGRTGIVAFSLNGFPDYHVSSLVRRSRKWIRIDFPSVTVDLPDRLTGGERIIGRVQARKAPGGGVSVFVEILPTGVDYEVFREEGSLFLKVTEQ